MKSEGNCGSGDVGRIDEKRGAELHTPRAEEVAWHHGAPKRIQLRRTKGWRKPEGAIVVSRPTKWGNPFAVVRCRRVICDLGDKHWHVLDNRDYYEADWALSTVAIFPDRDAAIADAIDRYRADLDHLPIPSDVLAELAGHDLACWCPLNQPCHADVLLVLANGGEL